MITCSYDVRMGEGGCREERTLDFPFCVTHMNTPRGKQVAMDVIAQGTLTMPSQVEEAIKAAQEVEDIDYQTSALEKMSQALDLIQGWADESRSNLDSLGGHENWRYRDRAGTEQQRTELGVFERAMDRLSRHLSSMSKVALEQKIVTLGKAQVDMMIRLMMAVITEMKLNPQQTDQAKMVLLQKLSDEANLVPRVERHAQKAIESSAASRGVDVSMTGGVTGVSIRGERMA